MSESKNLVDKINELCPDNRKQRHSFFQLQYFVIGKEPTIQGKIRACKIELLSRKGEVESILVAMDDLNDRIRLEELAINEYPPEKIEAEEIRVRQHCRNRLALQRQAEDLQATLAAKEDEANFLIGLCEKLLQVEPEKDWDSLEVQAEYWNAKLTREIETRLMLGELPNAEDFKTVLSLPNGMAIKDQTMKLIQERKRAALALQEKSADR
jgi:hypothetical protein